VPHIVVAHLLDEIAHAHVFDHALAQWTDVFSLIAAVLS
jgi:hypothetical protein